MKKIFILATSCLLITNAFGLSEKTTVEANFNVRHKVGNVDSFNRPKFINFHADIGENYWDKDNAIDDLRHDLLVNYDVYLGRNTGAISQVLNHIKEDPNRKGFADPNDLAQKGLAARTQYAEETKLHPYEKYVNLIVCNQFSPFYPNGTKTKFGKWALSQNDSKIEPFGTASGEFYGRYIKEFFGNGGESGEPKPAFCEIINEPLWDLQDKPNAPKTSIEKLFRFHSAVAHEMHKYNPNVPVGGYCTAFPNFEERDFQRWNERWKLFIDVAGKDMDFFTIHLYDFPAIGKKQKYRKGSNMEATMDMIEQYSFLKLKTIKPLMVSEYSAQTHNYNKRWSAYRDWLRIKSANSMMLQFMERANNINIAMPFIMLKSEWAYNPKIGYPHGCRMVRRENEPESFTGKYIYTDLVKFYKQWVGVKGTRVESSSDNLDIMCDAYVDGKYAYLIINNLEFKPVEINIKIHGAKYPKDIEVRHLYLEGEKGTGTPILDVSKKKRLRNITIGAEATCIIRYEYNKDIKINELMQETKYYATDYLKPIEKNQAISFNINGVKKADFGEATLRIGVGRNHDKVLQGLLTVNGNRVEMPTNYRGDEQKDRDTFFGVLEVPVDYSVIKKDNVISITYPDSGGHISTVTMQVFNFSSDFKHKNKNNSKIETEIK